MRSEDRSTHLRAVCAVLAAWLILAAFAGTAAAGALEDGFAAYARGDYAHAARLLRKAADQGDAGAQNALGVMYEKGQGVPQDYVQAHMWYSFIEALLPASKPALRDKAVRFRHRVAARMTPAQIAEANKLAREWRLKHGR